MELLGVGDLAVRWQYTARGVRTLALKPEFPAPCARINGGRIFVWELSAIQAFESGRAELSGPSYKKRKKVGYFIARTKGQSAPSSQPAGD